MLFPEEINSLLLIPVSSQDVGEELQLQLEICSQDLFLFLSVTMEHSTQEWEASANDADIETQGIDSWEVPSTSREPPQPLILV